MTYFSKSRVEAFSDGVFAIIVTLLVLELKVPHLTHDASMADLYKALLLLLPKLVSWVISFLMVCIIWVNHHRILDQIAHITHGVFWLNAFLLLWCSFIPFPTALLGDYLTNPVSSLVFGGVMALMSLTFSGLRWQAYRSHGVLKPDVNRAHFRKATVRSLLFGPLLYSTGALLGLVDYRLAMAVFALVPIYFIFFNSAQQSVAHQPGLHAKTNA
ncbi:TMEM175 family protein [Fibrella aquatilis]|uniref:DUF1211 domain-containing protein n=1 Tax=Fibrella aquatilis TaxID=2817059 RepID=A0A939JYJ1_9BACT|nr:TMEM175 family protein [Fibrella aquatilis]MBO0930428.1 DUF1211 domain-containing protein [Fibrella aquatilis]